MVIVFPIFPGVTQLDFTGPHQVFSRLPGARVIVASETGGSVEADGLIFAGLPRLSDIDRCEVLCVPGGPGTGAAMTSAGYMSQIRRLAGGAEWVTSVCTGSLILGAAGLLEGKRAACHWASRDLLPLLGAIAEEARVVRDGRVVTGGGVTAGIDFALALAAELGGVAAAQAIQLSLEYAPAPPFEAGRPETAPPEVLARVRSAMAQSVAERRAIAEDLARGR